MFGPITIVGNAAPGVPGGGPLVIDWTNFAQRTSLRPAEHVSDGQQMGFYRLAAASGALTTPAGGSAIFSARWAAAPAVCVLLRFSMHLGITTAFGAAQILDFDITKYTGFSAPDTGGTALTLTGNKNRTSNMANSSMADLRVCTTAALGAGTKTADANPFGYAVFPNNNTTQVAAASWVVPPFVDMYKYDQAGFSYPVVFAANEGFNVRPVTTLGATGVVKCYFVMEWFEIAAF